MKYNIEMPQALFPNLVSVESQKKAIQLIETLKIHRSYDLADVLGVGKFHENAAALGIWVEQQRKEEPNISFHDLTIRFMVCMREFNKKLEIESNVSKNPKRKKLLNLAMYQLKERYGNGIKLYCITGNATIVPRYIDQKSEDVTNE